MAFGGDDDEPEEEEEILKERKDPADHLAQDAYDDAGLASGEPDAGLVDPQLPEPPASEPAEIASVDLGGGAAFDHRMASADGGVAATDDEATGRTASGSTAAEDVRLAPEGKKSSEFPWLAGAAAAGVAAYEQWKRRKAEEKRRKEEEEKRKQAEVKERKAAQAKDSIPDATPAPRSRPAPKGWDSTLDVPPPAKTDRSAGIPDATPDPKVERPSDDASDES